MGTAQQKRKFKHNDTKIDGKILKPSSVVHLIRPAEDGERENARREPRVQNIFIYNGDRTVSKLQILL